MTSDRFRPALMLGALSSLLLVTAPAGVEAQRAPHVEVRRREPVVHQRPVQVRPDRFERRRHVTPRVHVQPPHPHHVIVPTAPPPPRRGYRARARRHDAVWVEGYWAWNGARHVWTAGRWQRQRANHVWIQPSWQPDGSGGYYFVQGHWAPDPTIGQPVPHYPAPPSQPYHPPTQSSNIVSACSSATIGDGALQQCIRLAQPLGAYAAQAVLACGAEVIGNGGLEQCLRAVQTSGPYTAGVIHACGAATIGNGAVEQCVRVATRARMDPTPAIQSCSQATIGEGAFLQCLESSVR